MSAYVSWAAALMAVRFLYVIETADNSVLVLV